MATPDWKGLFEWSMKHQDGTRPTGDMKQMKPEDRAWFEEAMQQYTIDLAERMVKIKQTLDKKDEGGSEELLHQKEQLLEELMEIVEHIDHARDLTKIGGLETLMGLLEDPQPSLRWRAAEVAGTCVQINPPVQDWFLQGGALPKLMKLLDDSDATCRQKGLLAVSCLIRNNPAGLEAFLATNGPSKLVSIAGSDTPRVQRKALQLLAHITREQPAATPVERLVPALLTLVEAHDSDLREAALAALVSLSHQPATSAQLRQAEGLRPVLERRQADLAARNGDAEGAADSAEDERRYVSQILGALDGKRATGTTAGPAGRGAPSAAAQPSQEQQPLMLLGGPSSS